MAKTTRTKRAASTRDVNATALDYMKRYGKGAGQRALSLEDRAETAETAGFWQRVELRIADIAAERAIAEVAAAKQARLDAAATAQPVATKSSGSRRALSRTERDALEGTQAKTGRPRSLLEERIQVRLTRDERASWTVLAAERGMDLGAFLRAGAALLAQQVDDSVPPTGKGSC